MNIYSLSLFLFGDKKVSGRMPPASTCMKHLVERATYVHVTWHIGVLGKGIIILFIAPGSPLTKCLAYDLLVSVIIV